MKIEIRRIDAPPGVESIQILSTLTVAPTAGSISIERTGLLPSVANIGQTTLTGLTNSIEITTKSAILISNQPKIEIRRIGIEPTIIQITARGLPGPSGGSSSPPTGSNSYFPSGW
jgi:hypothetical protein